MSVARPSSFMATSLRLLVLKIPAANASVEAKITKPNVVIAENDPKPFIHTRREDNDDDSEDLFA